MQSACIFVSLSEMMTIISHIEYLIKEHECVIIPGFGAFISYYTPSYVTEQGALIPPKLLYGFNAAIKHNDGLLANSIMRKNGISYDEAVDIIDGDVRIIKSQLDDSNEFIFGEIGVFSNAESGVLFEPNERISYSKSSMFGLRDIQLSEVGKQQQLSDASEKKDVVYISLRKDFFRIAASIIVLVVLAFALSTPIALDDAPDYAGVKFVAESQKTVVEQPMKSDVKAGRQTSVDTLNTTVSKKKESAVSPESESHSELAVSPDNYKYYLVIATFRTKKQAELYVKQSAAESDLEAKVLDNGGSLYRVYVAAGNSYDSLSTKLDDIYGTNPDAWIYKNTRRG